MKSDFAEKLDEHIRQIAREEIRLQQMMPSFNSDSTNHSHSPAYTLVSPCISRIGWIVKEGKLILLQSLLYSYSFIECDYKIFNKHFIGRSFRLEKMKWLGDKTQLVYLFELLINDAYVPMPSKRHKILHEHFTDKFGEVLDINVLRSTLNQLSDSSKGCLIIKEIFDKIKTTGNSLSIDNI